MPGHSSRRPAGRRPSCVSWKGWSVAPHPEGTRAPVLWGCVALLPPTMARLWTPCRPGEPPLSGPRAPGPRAAPRPRAISAGKSVRAVASPCPPPRHDGPRPPTAWAAEQPQACPPEAGQVGPQQEACRVRAGGSGCLGCCRHCSPCRNPASGGRRPTQLGSRASGSTVEWRGHRHPQGHGAGAPRLVSSSMGCSHRRLVPAGAASDADPSRGSRTQPGGMQEEVVHRGVLGLHVMQRGLRAP